MKTPIQELLESINTIIVLLPNEALGAKNQAEIIKAKAESLLEKEKQVIIEAWVDGGRMISNAKNAEQYYNETFK